jgi:DNA-binding NarL/FixJ family response regulator
MKLKQNHQPTIHVGIIDGDPVRMIGFRAILEPESGIELHAIKIDEPEAGSKIDLALVRDNSVYSLSEDIRKVKAAYPGARVLIIGSETGEEAILESLASGAHGYVHDNASASEFVSAIRVVSGGLIWGPRSALAAFIERASESKGNNNLNRVTITGREREVLKMLVGGKSNKEIAAPLGIEERTVKAHVSHLMRKMRVSNRIALSIHAVTHGVVTV